MCSEEGVLFFLKFLLHLPAFVPTISFIWNILSPFAFENPGVASKTNLTHPWELITDDTCFSSSLSYPPVLTGPSKTELVFSLLPCNSEIASILSYTDELRDL